MNRYKVVCADCKPNHANECGATLESWELADYKQGFECAICGEKFGPFPDFKMATSYKIIPLAAPQGQSPSL